jgi:hypothetical protein
MNRRRFVPSADGLEVRQLLATATAIPTVSAAATTVAPSPYDQRLQRIERLPFFLSSIEPNRSLPSGAVEAIQDNLLSIIGTLHAPPTTQLQEYNKLIRGILGGSSVSADQLQRLDRAFGKVLASAGANEATASSLRASLLQLERVSLNTASRPSSVAANDYTLILQLALALGKPLPAPTAVRLAPADDTGAKGDHATRVNQPSLVGTYSEGATIQILDSDGNVVGATKAGEKGAYSVRFAHPLQPGTYRVRVRAISAQGVASLSSQPFKLVILPPASNHH